QFRFPNKIFFVEFDRPVQPGAVGLGEAVGILTDNEVTALQPQNTLSFDTKWSNTQILAGFQQGFPDVQTIGSGHVNLVGELPGKSDAPQDGIGSPGDRAGADLHELERLRRQVDVGQPGQQGTGMWTGDIDTC